MLIIPDDEHAITLIPGHFSLLLLYMTLVHAYIVLINIYVRFFIYIKLVNQHSPFIRGRGGSLSFIEGLYYIYKAMK